MSIRERVVNTVPGGIALIGQAGGAFVMFAFGYSDNGENAAFWIGGGGSIAANTVLSANAGRATRKERESPYAQGFIWGTVGAGISTVVDATAYGAGVGARRVADIIGSYF